MAIGIEVVPTWNLVMNFTSPGDKYPEPTPSAIAKNIHRVRNLSKKESLAVVFSAISNLLASLIKILLAIQDEGKARELLEAMHQKAPNDIEIQKRQILPQKASFTGRKFGPHFFP